MTEMLLRYFRTKQKEAQTEKIYDTQCPFCSMQCKMQLIEQSTVTRKKYQTVGKDNPTSEGRLCIKGLNAHQHAVHTDRIKQPLLNVDGEFQAISWEKAYALIEEKFSAIQSEHGKNALSVYGSATITNEEAIYLESLLEWHLERSILITMAAYVCLQLHQQQRKHLGWTGGSQIV
ncbi:assimilatory nitrate reductase large subunit [Halalkalibacter akibai JCM 9157]|uniref:Assimilatory nitrate reductase large subunit n=1 Tax=Halalkalibacter akibai (strain ATCC 43226 / DSM 21942 / CIP 109018 / JCM 9157 / 1139) TaxID=1236973 RepID=W4QZU7_HALA3|nr:assimilatory nitrate reductase large subunit [Halalkalibacter akibai JCM 9157]